MITLQHLLFPGISSSISNAQQFLASSAFHTEDRACLLALTWEWDNALTRIPVYTDYTNLVRLLQFPTTQDIWAQRTINDILSMTASFYRCRILKVHKNDVAPAHILTTICRSTSFPFLFCWFWLLFLSCTISHCQKTKKTCTYVISHTKTHI